MREKAVPGRSYRWCTASGYRVGKGNLSEQTSRPSNAVFYVVRNLLTKQAVGRMTLEYNAEHRKRKEETDDYSDLYSIKNPLK